MIPKYLAPLILNLTIIACVIFVSCGDEGDVIIPELLTPQPQPEPDPPAALPGLPDDIAGYDQWLKLNAQPIPPAPGRRST